ncbi:MAG: hypothetical protein ACOX1P_30245 [Thermoguttaceae bacterium]
MEQETLFGQEEDDVYTPALTLWAFLSQVIQSGALRSCDAAVEGLRRQRCRRCYTSRSYLCHEMWSAETLGLPCCIETVSASRE